MRLVCRNISKSFTAQSKEARVLNGIDLSVSGREFVSIVGPSGCGKTTLLRIMAGLTEPTSGEVVCEDTGDGMGPIRMVFQDSGVFPWMNVVDNIAFGMQEPGLDRKDKNKRALELAEKVGIQKSALLYPHQLSVGMKKMVGLLRALASSPSVLLLDEPLSSIDIYVKEILRKEILTIWQDNPIAMVHVTHDIEEALALADRIFVISGVPGSICREFSVPLPRPRGSEALDSGILRSMKKEIWDIFKVEIERRVSKGII
ncbi:MAG TPA: nitrate ABC transporter ATP-binding protein [Candidatus Omnitrophica bacterium]|nr:nitrate ABC transporter ATP-binding protein [Candidatus Omnitrophota bacterium]